MNTHLDELFNDEKLVTSIKNQLPKLFRMAEIESFRAGKIGMQVGYIREDILISLLIYKFGEPSINTNIPKSETEVDTKLFGKPISIKTITGKSLSGVKLVWTVDAKNAINFQKNYVPSCDLLFAQIIWGNEGGLYYVPNEIQCSLLKRIGCERYIKLPKAGTNPRGAEITKEALSTLISANETKCIKINWQKPEINYNLFKRWVEYWNEEQ